MKPRILLITCLVLMAAAAAAWHVAGDRRSSQPAFRNGDQAFARGEYEQAIQAWKQMLARGDESPGLLAGIGRAYVRLARFEKALSYFERALALDPDSVSMELELARVECLTGNADSAQARCERVLERDADNAEAALLMGDVHMIFHAYAKAEQMYRRALDLSSGAARCLLKLAVCLASEGRQGEAQQMIEAVGQTGGTEPGLYLQMADASLVTDDYAAAEKYLLQAVEQDPGNRVMAQRLAEFYVSTGAFDKSEPILEGLVRSGDRDLYSRKMLADVCLSAGKPTKADSLLGEIGKQLERDDVEYELLQGKYWLMTGDPVYAATHFETASMLASGVPVIHYYLGISYLAGGQSQLGENSIATALAIDPGYQEARLLKAEIEYRQGEYDQSVNNLIILLEQDPGNVRGYVVRGLNYAAMGQYGQAQEDLETALAFNPGDTAALFFLGIVSESIGNLSRAKEIYQTLLQEHPGFADVSYRNLMLQINDPGVKDPRHLISELVIRFPDNLHLQYVAARAAQALGDDLQAESLLTEWTVRQEAPGYFYVALADIFTGRNQPDKAVEVLQACVERIPLFADAWICLSELHLDRGMYQRARDVLEKADRTLPGTPAILSNLAWVLLEMDSDLDMALEYARSAYDKHPSSGAVADTLGWAYYKRGGFGQAEWILSEVNRQNPDNSLVLYHLGMTLHKQGKTDEAMTVFKTIKRAELSLADTMLLDEAISAMEASAGISGDHSLPARDLSEALSFPGDKLDQDTVLRPQWQRQ